MRRDKITNLMDHCRYYKREIPDTEDANIHMCAFCEQKWIEFMEDRDNTLLSHLLSDYFEYGLKEFSLDDGVPVSLKAVLANRYFQYNERIDIPAFKVFYNKYYTKEKNQKDNNKKNCE